jgi:23S rRNA (uracil1939-C5)-methyltransferase
MVADEPQLMLVRPTHFVVGGAALGRDGTGRVVFVNGALPGETVQVEVRERKKDFTKADVVAVVEPSPERVAPACEVWHRGCGGCDWQHIASSAQLELKAEIVHEALSRQGRIHQPTMYLGGSVPAWAYRTTVRLATAPSGAVGFRARESHTVVETTHCPVAHPAINGLIASLGPLDIGEVMLRVGLSDGEHTMGIRRDRSSVVVSARTYVEEVVAGVRLRVSAGSFFQSCPQAAELLVQSVGRAVADIDLSNATVIDAFGGVGLFAATVCAAAARVIVVESSSSACDDARCNLAGRADTSDVVNLRLEQWDPQPAAVVIADPARAGLDKAGVAKLAATGASRIVLVSCDPASLARDTVLLRGAGYQHRWSEVFDLFPQTSHIEVVTVYGLE